MSRQFNIELTSGDALTSHIESGQSLDRVVLSRLDLTSETCENQILGVTAHEALFLGCTLSQRLAAHVRSTGGMIFPVFEDLPFNPYRSSLYSVGELMQGYERGDAGSVEHSTDAKIYAYYQSHRRVGTIAPVIETLACRLHDHAIDRALQDELHPAQGARKVVGIMGGHKLRRDDGGFSNVARIAHELATNGLYVATGGGPGAMEAGNLGAWMVDQDATCLKAAIEVLAPSPEYNDSHYIDRAYDVLDEYPSGGDNLAVPTWFYGHEPSNLFATHIAKYFANSIREDGLLAIATHGVIFSPGSAGTIQEIFQDAAQNHYASLGVVSPMVFLGKEYWSAHLPAYPLIKALSRDRAYGSMTLLTDEPDEAVAFILANPPHYPDLI